MTTEPRPHEDIMIEARVRTAERLRITRELRLKAIEYRADAERELLEPQPRYPKVRAWRDMATNLEKQAYRIDAGIPLCRPKETP